MRSGAEREKTWTFFREVRGLTFVSHELHDFCLPIDGRNPKFFFFHWEATAQFMDKPNKPTENVTANSTETPTRFFFIHSHSRRELLIAPKANWLTAGMGTMPQTQLNRFDTGTKRKPH